MADITLYQFDGSHYNEKARWALDLKQVPHARVSLMPGPHAPRMKKLTGRTETPVLVDGGKVIAGSADILAHLERRFPEPGLFPESPPERERALAIAGEFDAEVGPAIRLAMFHEVMDREYALRRFCAGQSRFAQRLYGLGFPIVSRVMKRSMHIDAENAERGRARTLRAFDFVARTAGPEGYLVGGRFSVADLTCAALLMPALDLADVGGPAVADTAAEKAWFAHWADHPGADWVRSSYAGHRRC